MDDYEKKYEEFIDLLNDAYSSFKDFKETYQRFKGERNEDALNEIGVTLNHLCFYAEAIDYGFDKPYEEGKIIIRSKR